MEAAPIWNFTKCGYVLFGIMRKLSLGTIFVLIKEISNKKRSVRSQLKTILCQCHFTIAIADERNGWPLTWIQYQFINKHFFELHVCHGLINWELCMHVHANVIIELWITSTSVIFHYNSSANYLVENHKWPPNQLDLLRYVLIHKFKTAENSLL